VGISGSEKMEDSVYLVKDKGLPLAVNSLLTDLSQQVGPECGYVALGLMPGWKYLPPSRTLKELEKEK
jgi:hypothetical protein